MNRYLVLQLARFGDLIQTKRLMLSLSAGTGSEVHLVVDRSLKEMAGLVYPGAKVHTIQAHGGGVSPADVAGSTYDFLQSVRGLDFTAIYNLNFSGLNFSLVSNFDPELVRGYRYKEGQYLKDGWPSLAFRWSGPRRSSAINLMDFWGYYAENPIPAQEVNPGPEPGGGGIGVVMAGREQRRSLPLDVLAAVIRLHHQQQGGRIVLLGSGSEEKVAAKLKSLLSTGTLESVRDLTGRTGWKDLIEEVSGLDLLLTPDTGTMHLAAHLGVPVRAFFLSSAWCFETGPYGQGHQVFQATAPCAPCLEVRTCSRDLVCLEPFRQAGFLKHLSGRSDEPLESLVGYTGFFDELGINYRAAWGDDQGRDTREHFRQFLMAHLGLDSLPKNDLHDLCTSLYLEKDWQIEDRQ